jgi:putative salt-induced outer membrane protein
VEAVRVLVDRAQFPAIWVSVLAGAISAAGIAHATALPGPVARMIEAAANDPETLDAVVRVAKKTNPNSIAEIDAQVAQLKAQSEARKTREAATQGFFHGWQGKGQVGANISTGNTQQEGLALGLDLEKDAPRWWYTLDATADVLREDKEVTKERYFLSIATHYKITRRAYVVGVLWGESDRFAGYYSRFSESLGLGYRLVDNSTVKLRVEGGPALREANYIETGREQSGSFRAAEYLSWNFGLRNEFTQSVVGYLQSGNSTVIGSTALTTKLYDALAARASFEIRYESQPPRGRVNTDTTSRVALVYGF